MRTSSTSPGAAPSTKIGPVRMWPPGPRSVTWSSMSRSSGWPTSAGQAHRLEAGRGAREHGLDVDDVARRDAQHGLGRVVVPKRHGRRARFQTMDRLGRDSGIEGRHHEGGTQGEGAGSWKPGRVQGKTCVGETVGKNERPRGQSAPPPRVSPAAAGPAAEPRRGRPAPPPSGPPPIMRP